MGERKLKTGLTAALLTAFAQLAAQNAVRENEFLKELTNTSAEGAGSVSIYQDARLPEAIADRQNYTEENREAEYIFIAGYRVQAYSSNVPRTARAEAFALDTRIKERMPDVPTYVSFTSPFWKVRLGDCRTYQEAMTLLAETKKSFPEEKNNFYIVKDNIRISIK